MLDVTQEHFVNQVMLIWIQFSLQTDCHSKAKEPNRSYNFPIAREKKRCIPAFLKSISMKWKTYSLLQYLNSYDLIVVMVDYINYFIIWFSWDASFSVSC